MSSKNTQSLKGSGQSLRKQSGAVVVVTGAAGGIGAAVVQRLATDGWHVIATDVSASEIQLPDGRFPHPQRSLCLDVSDAQAVQRLAELLQSEGSTVAGLVNVAGVLQNVEPLIGFDPVAMRRVWDINYFGAQTCIQAFGTLMKNNGGGSIVNITSINAHKPLPLHAYSPAKAALAALTALAAGDLGRFGIRVNAVAPGFTLTPIMKNKIDTGARDGAAIERQTALSRLVETPEVAAAVSFLLSDDASAISGASIPVDAGWLATSHWMDMSEQLDRQDR
jgi:NAD(P)-dependent dehydrogenase (short-subunit alcohol dehydrogenase family)